MGSIASIRSDLGAESLPNSRTTMEQAVKSSPHDIKPELTSKIDLPSNDMPTIASIFILEA
jgi:hypothetical protein